MPFTQFCTCKDKWQDLLPMHRLYIRVQVPSKKNPEKVVQGWHPVGWLCKECQRVTLDGTDEPPVENTE